MSIIAPAAGQGSGAGAGSPDQGSAPGAGSGNQQADWRSAIPEDIRGHAALASYKDIASLAKSHIHAQSLVGADKLVLPGKDATPEQRAEFYKKLGRPDEAKGYDLRVPQGMDPKSVSPERLAQWQGKLHELGLTKAQGEALIEQYLGEEFKTMSAQTAAREERLKADEAAVRAAFGAKYDESLNFVRLALNQFGSDELYKAIDEAGLGNNPAFVKAFADIGRRMADDGGPRGSGNGSRTGVVNSPETAQAEIRRIETDPEMRNALFDGRHPRHAEIVKLRAELFKTAYPSSPG